MVLCLTGFSCVGKTSVSKLLMEKYNYKLISVRNVSHELAMKNGYSRTREWLIDTTVAEYLKRCREEILSMVNDNISTNIVIDDLFDIELWNDIAKNYESLLINLCIDEKTRINRMCIRESFVSVSMGHEELRFLDGWKINFGIKDVISLASNSIDVSDMTIAEIAQEIMSITH